MIQNPTTKKEIIGYIMKHLVIGGIVIGVGLYVWNLYQTKKTTTPSTNTD